MQAQKQWAIYSSYLYTIRSSKYSSNKAEVHKARSFSKSTPVFCLSGISADIRSNRGPDALSKELWNYLNSLPRDHTAKDSHYIVIKYLKRMVHSQSFRTLNWSDFLPQPLVLNPQSFVGNHFVMLSLLLLSNLMSYTIFIKMLFISGWRRSKRGEDKKNKFTFTQMMNFMLNLQPW